MNDREEKQNLPEEESEYHFSEDEVNYEAEPASHEPPPPKPSRLDLLSRLSNSKRMLISLGIFFVLIFIVYKMVAPTNTVPATDITPAGTMAAQPTKAPPKQPVVATENQAPASMPISASQQTTNPSSSQSASFNNAANVNQSSQPLSLPNQPIAQPTAPPQAIVQPVIGTPNLIPVTSTQESSQGGTYPVPSGGNLQMVNQLQSDYVQRMNEFAAQNKATQDQIQALSARVQVMENELHQLVQSLNPSGNMPPPVGRGEPSSLNVIHQAPVIKTNLTVQAIIPGRAWLKRQDGETLTVAEGDIIRGLGQVSKIDPYDGVVEVTSGNQVISISYGAGV